MKSTIVCVCMHTSDPLCVCMCMWYVQNPFPTVKSQKELKKQIFREFIWFVLVFLAWKHPSTVPLCLILCPKVVGVKMQREHCEHGAAGLVVGVLSMDLEELEWSHLSWPHLPLKSIALLQNSKNPVVSLFLLFPLKKCDSASSSSLYPREKHMEALY